MLFTFRHWKELMERTGTSFEINTGTFTLENMFSMELHKYADVIGEIVASAVKELGIEKARLHNSDVFGLKQKILAHLISKTFVFSHCSSRE